MRSVNRQLGLGIANSLTHFLISKSTNKLFSIFYFLLKLNFQLFYFLNKKVLFIPKALLSFSKKANPDTKKVVFWFSFKFTCWRLLLTISLKLAFVSFYILLFLHNILIRLHEKVTWSVY